MTIISTNQCLIAAHKLATFIKQTNDSNDSINSIREVKEKTRRIKSHQQNFREKNQDLTKQTMKNKSKQSMPRHKVARYKANSFVVSLALLSSCCCLLFLQATSAARQHHSQHDHQKLSSALTISDENNEQDITRIGNSNQVSARISRDSELRVKQATCGYPGSPAHASVSFSNTPVVAGSSASYTCDNGYELLGPPRRVCQANGTWAPIGIPFCGK